MNYNHGLNNFQGDLDTTRYYCLEIEECHKEGLNEWVERGELEALVDEESGGIIGYVNRVHVGTLLKYLNCLPHTSPSTF